MTEQALQGQMLELVSRWGDIGVFIAMFLESSIVPIPSELIVIGAGAVGVPLRSVILFGGAGSALGALVGYVIGKYAAYPVILRFGKYVFIKPRHLQKAEEFARRYGAWGVLGGRLMPVVPFKVFSIASGIVRTPLFVFTVFTLIGVLPRIYLLAVFGSVIVKCHRIALAAVILVIAAVCLVVFLKKRRSTEATSP